MIHIEKLLKFLLGPEKGRVDGVVVIDILSVGISVGLNVAAESSVKILVGSMVGK